MSKRRSAPAPLNPKTWLTACMIASVLGMAATLVLGTLYGGPPRADVEFVLAPARVFSKAFGDLGLVLGPALIYGLFPALGFLILRGSRDEE